ncbi:MAG: hypothetical protein LUI39_12720 [Lachnospiraceae bacterium]|nr:hypothetical protein [Lachnospiraceae bacterium]
MESKLEDKEGITVQNQQDYPVGEAGWEQVSERYLDVFEADLKAAGRSERIKNRDMSCAYVYLNYFLQHLMAEESPDAEISTLVIKDENREILVNGCRKLGYYISYYYIQKDWTASPYNLEQTVQAIKNFYECMMNHGYVSGDDFDYLCSEIESDLDGWLEECEQKCVEDFGEDEWRKMRKGETYFI